MGLSTKLCQELRAERKRLVARIEADQDAVAAIDLALGRKSNGAPSKVRGRRGGAHWKPGERIGPLSKQLLRAIHVHPGSTSHQAGGWAVEHRLPDFKHVPKQEVLHRATAAIYHMEKLGLVITERSAGIPYTHRLTPAGQKAVESWSEQKQLRQAAAASVAR